MADTPIKPITSGYNVSKINDNFQNLQTKLDNNVLGTSQGQNVMFQQLDMNDNDIINAGNLSVDALTIAGTAVVPTNLGSYAPNSVGTVQVIDGAITNSKLTSGIDGTKLNFIQQGAGAVTRVNQDKERERVTPKDFGAKGDGATDDYASFNQLVTNNNHGPINIPAGNYVFNTSISIPNDLIFDSGATLFPGIGVTITLTGSIRAEDYQIFNKSNGGTVVLNDLARDCRPAWFGMLPRNSASINTQAFGDLMLALTPQDLGAVVKFPCGQINVNSLTVTKSNITLEGHMSGTWLINNTSNQPCINLNNISASHNTIRGLTIGQASGVGPLTNNSAIYIKAQNCILEDCLVFPFPAAPWNGIIVDGTIALMMSKCTVFGMIHDGFQFIGNCGDIFAWALYSNGNGSNGFYFNGMSGLYGVTLNGFGNGNNCFFFDNTGHPNGSGTINEFVYAHSWIGDTSAAANYNILNLADSSFDSCWGSTQSSTSVNPFSSGFNISSAGCTDISFTGCHALSNNGAGYVVDAGASNITFNNCHARVNGKAGVSTNGGFYIGLGSPVTNVTLIGCRARSNTGYGMTLGPYASDYLIINGNNNQGNTLGTIQNSSTGTHNLIGVAGNV